LNAVVNNHAPDKNLSKRKIKELTKPWITKVIRRSIKIKNKLYVNGYTANINIIETKLHILFD